MPLAIDGLVFGEGVAVFWACGGPDGCGAAVADPNAHVEWHRRTATSDVLLAEMNRNAALAVEEFRRHMEGAEVTPAPAAVSAEVAATTPAEPTPVKPTRAR